MFLALKIYKNFDMLLTTKKSNIDFDAAQHASPGIQDHVKL